MSLVPAEVNRACRDLARDLINAILEAKISMQSVGAASGTKRKSRDHRGEDLILATVILLMLTLEEPTPIGRKALKDGHASEAVFYEAFLNELGDNFDILFTLYLKFLTGFSFSYKM